MDQSSPVWPANGDRPPRRETVGDTIYGETIEGRSRGEFALPPLRVCAMAFTVDRCDDQFLKPPETLAAKCH